jgi:tetratricopeptide (TPR) repeat protein
MKRAWLPVIAVIAWAALSGCAGSMDSLSAWVHSGPWWRAEQVETISVRARELEARGELGMALDHWRLVEDIAADPKAAEREIQRLEEKIDAAVRSHYQAGLAKVTNNRPTDARNHFLAALRLDPTFYPALRQIRARFSPFPIRVYQTVPGDRPASVAKKFFGDEKKAFLVAWFNHLPEGRALPPGSLLILPKWEDTGPPEAKEKPVPDALTLARDRLSAGDLQGALTLTSQADPSDPEVQALTHTIRLEQAAQQIDAGGLADAATSLAAVPDGFEGKAAIAQTLDLALKQRQFNLDLNNARELFDQGRYGPCLDQAEMLMQRAPDNTVVARLAAEARYRLALEHFDHQRYREARTVLENMEESHEAGTALKEAVHARLVELAQVHYRNGVKHFINEDLNKAISEWEIALECDPDHAKARENIENARRLLEKIETLP